MTYDSKRYADLAGYKLGNVLDDLARTGSPSRIIRDWLPDGRPFFAYIAVGETAMAANAILAQHDPTGLKRENLVPALRVLPPSPPPAAGSAILLEPSDRSPEDALKRAQEGRGFTRVRRGKP